MGRFLFAIVIGFGLGPGSVLAADGGGWAWSWDPGPKAVSPGGNISIKARGRLYLDHAWISDSDNTLDLAASEFRAARFGIDAKFGNGFALRAEGEFSGSDPQARDLYLAWSGPVAIKGGHMKLPHSMEEATSSRFVPLMERASYTDAFGFTRQLGIVLTHASRKGMLSAGAFQGGIVGAGDSRGLMLAARLTRAPRVGSATVHLGVSVRYREPGDKQGPFRYRQRPHQHQAPRFIDTTAVAQSDTFFGIEGGVFKGPFSFASEWGLLRAELAAPEAGQGDPTFFGGHVTLTYYLTGENQPYQAEKGGLDRPHVLRPVFRGGPGAWQMVMRYDYIDLADNGILGGVQKTLIGGVNWWLSSHMKVTLNVSWSRVSQAFLVAANGADGANAITAVGLRTQIDW